MIKYRHPRTNIRQYLASLINSERLGSQVVFQTVLPGSPAHEGASITEYSPEIQQALGAAGIKSLYRHQSRAIEIIRRGQNVIVATPTASGKTLIYNLPVLERFQTLESSKSLYLFPLKALAQDQLKAFEKMAAFFINADLGSRVARGNFTPRLSQNRT